MSQHQQQASKSARSHPIGAASSTHPRSPYLPRKDGRCFQQRQGNWAALFARIPLWKHNSINVKLDDDGPFGNDDARINLLSRLSMSHVTELSCAVCLRILPIYDRYPLVDGTLFLSYQRHRRNKLAPISISQWPSMSGAVTGASGSSNSQYYRSVGGSTGGSGVGGGGHHTLSYRGGAVMEDQFLHAICLECLHGAYTLTCKYCQTPWDYSRHLVIGSIYQYDIFAAVPCCDHWLACTKCGKSIPYQPVADQQHQSDGGAHWRTTGHSKRQQAYARPYFNHANQELKCNQCGSVSRHSLKPIEFMYSIEPK